MDLHSTNISMIVEIIVGLMKCEQSELPTIIFKDTSSNLLWGPNNDPQPQETW